MYWNYHLAMKTGVAQGQMTTCLVMAFVTEPF